MMYLAIGGLACVVVVLAFVLLRGSSNQPLPPASFTPRNRPAETPRAAPAETIARDVETVQTTHRDEPASEPQRAVSVPNPRADANVARMASEDLHALLAACESLARTNKIAAIKHWRSATGVGLHDAKLVIDALVERGAAGVPAALLGVASPQCTTSVASAMHDILAEPARITGPSRDELLAECEALARNDRIRAIKRWREATGVGLRDAKALIDSLVVRGASGTPAAILDAAWPSVALPSVRVIEIARPEPETNSDEARRALLVECVSIARSGNKIEAIKRYRAGTGDTLHDAKEAIDRAMRQG